MTTVLVDHGSKMDGTEGIARQIAETLRQRGLRRLWLLRERCRGMRENEWGGG